MDWLTIADHSAIDIMGLNFPDLKATLLALAVKHSHVSGQVRVR